METKVYVLWSTPLFLESIRLILEGKEVLWSGHSYDLQIAQSEIVSKKPDTVLIEYSEGNKHWGLLEIFEACPKSFKIIALNLIDNQILLIQSEKKSIQQIEDLIQTIMLEATPLSEE